MKEFAVNYMLLNISKDGQFNEATRELARVALTTDCSVEAKIALLETCIKSLE